MTDYSIERRYEDECPHDEGFYTDDEMHPQELCVRCGSSRVRDCPTTCTSHSRSKLYEFTWNEAKL